MEPASTLAWIGIGGNLGDARATVETAIARLAALPQTQLLRSSSLYRTAPVDASGDDYVNAVALVSTTLPALDLLHALQAIELQHGRERPYRNAPRTLDLDVLMYGEARIADQELTVPHPRMVQRAFVLAPLLEIDENAVIPGVGAARPLLDAITDQPIRRI
ncbi:2-amino-4-hydroxy-6-hydroxymethyldihydropteridine diphosphokinase [Herbaspirillum seropedicae]|uniref:2-amino-4-hydroxy-6-hydroxymethyldihydropteridine pyrophosphokinase n=1 Tax=Herbaspirillum seropedicae (strain SmR1) TaxID=757424 RepID=D8IYI7_HERSS|nr:2-amino-4-hydroxy-6-hydroxymethyldihydropteridine diphosphokinase [Herbaspirillum seropedicae]ADJ62147.1 2-amino-4-hydroxy-6-hydroxymethyldihydropteridine pyrophosphokinase protein [Herbaspirillum seropedicae SmR1]AKN64314.1 2-amino-4-hydroxy-6-hydroxymethyldihydropteridine pyrophosphokinase [Herbaspirillum seropedicae]NQE27819.1 2-amino-4-hydroxy-6-hydroxymethyldihydropteridine pyrophosphokinase [Herbaspirillum seropedicae]UMU20230.1 2-amino-4-hydroxy-6-hydroxymethyldihydropteridine diphosp